MYKRPKEARREDRILTKATREKVQFHSSEDLGGRASTANEEEVRNRQVVKEGRKKAETLRKKEKYIKRKERADLSFPSLFPLSPARRRPLM